MKRSWITYLLVAGLLTLLAILGVLQYRGLTQINRTESEKAHARVQEQADRFAMDFNREMQNAYFNFQTDAESWRTKNWAPFNERLDYWRERTTYPELIDDFYFFEAEPQSPPLKYDKATRAFVPVESTPDLTSIRTRISDEKSFHPVFDDIYTLALPIHNVGPKLERIVIRPANGPTHERMTMPPRYGFLAIKLNESVIKERVLPDLAAKYFGDGEYRVAVGDKAGNDVFQSLSGENRDATAPLLNLAPDNFIQFTNKNILSAIDGERRHNVTVSSRLETTTLVAGQPLDAKPETFQFEVKKDGQPRTTVFARTSADGGNADSPWMLMVQHSSGSLDAYLASTLRQNLAMGFGILALLAVAVIAIIASAQRAKMFAQRQVDFVSSVSHEFRTPLAVIYSAGENLADGVAKKYEQVSRYGELIKGEGKKLSGMVEQILDFAGADSGRKQYNFVDINVADVVKDALAECSALLEGKEINVETDISVSLPTVKADRSALSGAIQNLIVNAVKYGNGSNWIRVTAENGGGNIKISVEDHGIGISKGELRQIFQPFYRSQEVVDAQIHGNGLGLSLVRQIAKAHGGCVHVTSEVGKGSKFIFEIPANGN
ncbi:MAG: HAMP domain-containing histidine kinase [Pyrinomonadaceae bacterium]|nr:HAMP domain-containing histidine kinase [Pyrinomonadaceae bacterium]MBP6212812.1 HAMP domain-containing histidine kinase [Pyrinomonadaceae bacterium]